MNYFSLPASRPWPFRQGVVFGAAVPHGSSSATSVGRIFADGTADATEQIVVGSSDGFTLGLLARRTGLARAVSSSRLPATPT